MRERETEGYVPSLSIINSSTVAPMAVRSNEPRYNSGALTQEVVHNAIFSSSLFFSFFLFDVSYDCSLVERISPSFLTRHLVPTRLPLPASIIHHDAFGNICFSLKNHATGARESPPQQHETLVLDQQDNSSRVPFTKKTSRAIFTCVFFYINFFICCIISRRAHRVLLPL